MSMVASRDRFHAQPIHEAIMNTPAAMARFSGGK